MNQAAPAHPFRSAVVTFCSVGDVDARHRAVVNVAVLLAQAGLRVGVAALDSAPLRLDRRFANDPKEWDDLRVRPGLWNLVNEYKVALTSAARADLNDAAVVESVSPDDTTIIFGSLRLRRPSTYLVSYVPQASWEQGARIYLLPAGGRRESDDRPTPPLDWTRFDWADFVTNLAGAAYLKFVRDDLLQNLDVLLTSNGASLTEATRAMTSRFADIVVVLTDYENNNMEQSDFLCQLLGGSPPTGWAEGPPPLILPLAGEIDTGSERELLGSGRRQFGEMFRRVLPSPIDAEEFFYRSEIPAVPFYRQSGGVVALAPAHLRDRGLFEAYRYLTDTIVRAVSLGSFVPIGDACDPVRAFARAQGRVRWDVFISYASPEAGHARRLSDDLAAVGLRAFVAAEDITLHIGTDEWKAALERVLDRSESLLLLVTPAAMQSRWVEYEWSLFAKTGGLIIPVCLEGPSPPQLPDTLQRYHAIDCRATGVEPVHLAMLNELIAGAIRHSGRARAQHTRSKEVP